MQYVESLVYPIPTRNSDISGACVTQSIGFKWAASNDFQGKLDHAVAASLDGESLKEDAFTSFPYRRNVVRYYRPQFEKPLTIERASDTSMEIGYRRGGEARTAHLQLKEKCD